MNINDNTLERYESKLSSMEEELVFRQKRVEDAVMEVEYLKGLITKIKEELEDL